MVEVALSFRKGIFFPPLHQIVFSRMVLYSYRYSSRQESQKCQIWLNMAASYLPSFSPFWVLSEDRVRA